MWWLYALVASVRETWWFIDDYEPKTARNSSNHTMTLSESRGEYVPNRREKKKRKTDKKIHTQIRQTKYTAQKQKRE